MVRFIHELSDLEKLSLMDMSYSRLETFQGDFGCPAKFFYSYVLKEPQQFSAPAMLGNIIHSTLEEVLQPNEPINFDDLLSEYKVQVEAWDTEKQIPEEMLLDGSTMLAEFADRHDGFAYPIEDKEFAFEVVIAGALFRGFIDRVDVTDTRVTITDYKAQPLDTPILTPTGWVKMGDIKVGDLVIGKNGKATKVMGVYPQGIIPAFRIHFTDGSSTICSTDHLWTVSNLNKGFKTLPLNELGDLRAGFNYKYSIPTVDPVEFEHTSPLPIHPYILGVVLGDGGLTSNDKIKLHCEDQSILYRVNELLPEGHSLVYDWKNTTRITSGQNHKNKILSIFRDYGLMGRNSSEKFIPEPYLYGSINERLELLKGLMDTDGGCSTRTEFRTTSPFFERWCH